MYDLETHFHTDGEPICGLIAYPPSLVVATWGGSIQLRTLNSPFKIVKEITNKVTPFTCFTNLNNLLFINKGNTWIEIWDLVEIQKINRFQINMSKPCSLAVSTDFLVITNNLSFEVIDLKSRESIGLIDISGKKSKQKVERMFIDGNRLIWKFSNSEEIHIWSLTTFKEEYTFTSEPSISSFLIVDNFLFIATEDCVETGEYMCTLNIWDFRARKLIKRLEGYEDEFYFMIDTTNSSFDQPKTLIAATINSVDIWEWGTWKHLDRIEDIGVVHHCLLANNKIFVGDIEGYVNIWQKKCN